MTPDKQAKPFAMEDIPWGAKFYEAFGVTEGDGHWLPPEERVKIW